MTLVAALFALPSGSGPSDRSAAANLAYTRTGSRNAARRREPLAFEKSALRPAFASDRLFQLVSWSSQKRL